MLSRPKEQGWGAKVVDRLAAALRREFPGIEGVFPRSLNDMWGFTKAWPDEAIVQEALAQIPWGHNVRLLDLVKDREAREWYARAVIENGWSRNVLVHWTYSGLPSSGVRSLRFQPQRGGPRKPGATPREINMFAFKIPVRAA
ncbi:DUF1016 N-terminal domain-containing protein [Singulisphaera sp. GP187]|uniref:DUF1016 N-terminal domain-containing protein n=1 Tax=Singulisphaera sp. GP187 TaxID=1882752 RepID=UPI0020B12DB4